MITLDTRRLTRFSECGVYFFLLGSELKIGCSRQISARVKTLRTIPKRGQKASDRTGRMLAVYPCPPESLQDTERAWHRRFAQHRIETEWFVARPVVDALRRSGVLLAVGDVVPA